MGPLRENEARRQANFLRISVLEPRNFRTCHDMEFAEFTRELYEYALKMKKQKRLNFTLRRINKAAGVRHGVNRMFGYVKRASVPGWQVRQ